VEDQLLGPLPRRRACAQDAHRSARRQHVSQPARCPPAAPDRRELRRHCGSFTLLVPYAPPAHSAPPRCPPLAGGSFTTKERSRASSVLRRGDVACGRSAIVATDHVDQTHPKATFLSCPDHDEKVCVFFRYGTFVARLATAGTGQSDRLGSPQPAVVERFERVPQRVGAEQGIGIANCGFSLRREKSDIERALLRHGRQDSRHSSGQQRLAETGRRATTLWGFASGVRSVLLPQPILAKCLQPR
jgi:hypothetical protein